MMMMVVVVLAVTVILVHLRTCGLAVNQPVQVSDTVRTLTRCYQSVPLVLCVTDQMLND